MKCPFCDFWDTQVKNSRPSGDASCIKRRRFCHNCGARFTTFEKVEIKEIIVIKRNGDKRIFDEEKLRKSLEVAIRKRPMSKEKIAFIVNNIIKKLEKFSEGEVSSKMIGNLAMGELRQLDQVACVRYASVYQDFSDVHDFVKFINDIIGDNNADTNIIDKQSFTQLEDYLESDIQSSELNK